MQCAITLIFSIILCVHITHAEELQCDFVRHSDGYNCEMKTVFETQKEVTSVNDNHKFGNGNTDVDVLFVQDMNKSKYMPLNVCSVFPNLYKIDIYGSSLISLNKQIFEGCKKLSKVVIKYVKFKTLDEDLFTHVENLTHVVIGFTHVESLPAKLFEKNMETLQSVDISFNKIKTLNTEFPTTLTMLSVMNNECIDNHYDKRSTTRTNTLPDLLQEIKDKCGSENAGKTMTLTLQAEEMRKLKENIDENEKKVKALESSLQGADMALGLKIAQQNTEIRALKTDIASGQKDTAEIIKKFKEEMNTKYEDFFNITSKLNDESRQLKVKLEYNSELKARTDELEAHIGRNNGFIITVFILQLVLIVFIVLAVLYVKFYSSNRGQVRSGGLLSGDGTF